MSKNKSRKTPSKQEDILVCGDISLDVKKRTLVKGTTSYQLTPKECRLLEVLMLHSGQILSRKDLMQQVWETDYLDDTRTLDVHIHWVRKKIEGDPKRPEYLRTMRGVGYWFGNQNGKEADHE